MLEETKRMLEEQARKRDAAAHALLSLRGETVLGDTTYLLEPIVRLASEAQLCRTIISMLDEAVKAA